MLMCSIQQHWKFVEAFLSSVRFVCNMWLQFQPYHLHKSFDRGHCIRKCVEKSFRQFDCVFKIEFGQQIVFEPISNHHIDVFWVLPFFEDIERFVTQVAEYFLELGVYENYFRQRNLFLWLKKSFQKLSTTFIDTERLMAVVSFDSFKWKRGERYIFYFPPLSMVLRFFVHSREKRKSRHHFIFEQQKDKIHFILIQFDLNETNVFLSFYLSNSWQQVFLKVEKVGFYEKINLGSILIYLGKHDQRAVYTEPS